jgi:hypothetical protein
MPICPPVACDIESQPSFAVTGVPFSQLPRLYTG